MSERISICFVPDRRESGTGRPVLVAGETGTCEVQFNEEYRGNPADLIVSAYGQSVSESGASPPCEYEWLTHTQDFFPAQIVYVTGVRIPHEFADDGRVTFTARLAEPQSWRRRRDRRRERRAPDPLEQWLAVSEAYELSDPEQRSEANEGSAAVGPLVGRPTDRVDSFYQVLAARDPGANRRVSVEEVFNYVLEGLNADLGELIDEAYRTYDDEIGEDGRHLEALMPWQKWAIQYCTGLYYSQNYHVYRSLDRGLGYPIGVACNSHADMYAWFRGLEFPSDEDSLEATSQTSRCEEIRDTHLTQLAESQRRSVDEAVADAQRAGRAYARYEAAGSNPRAPIDPHSLRPGSILTFDDHINTVFRVRRSGDEVRFLLFDTGGTRRPTESDLRPPILGSAWGGAMKEEPWQTTPPEYSGGHRVTGHLFVPSRTRDPAEVPKTLFIVPRGPSDAQEEISETSRRSPLVRLCIIERATERVAFCSAPFPLTVPLTQLVYSVTNLPSSEQFEARWFVDGGFGQNKHVGNRHGRNATERMLLEIHNTSQVVAPPAGSNESFRRFQTLHLRPGYPENCPQRARPHRCRHALEPALERSDLKRATYLGDDDTHDPRERYALSRDDLATPKDRALYEYFCEQHPLDTPRHSDRAI